MKDISELELPEDLQYTENHEWAREENGKVRIGISDYAQDQLGDIVYVELPGAGESFKKDDQFGTVESVKAVSEIYMPLGGKVLEVNAALQDAPERVNSAPYGEGWLIVIEASDPGELGTLKSREDYLNALKGIE